MIEQMPKGTNYATSIAAQTRLAEIITSRVASVDHGPLHQLRH